MFGRIYEKWFTVRKILNTINICWNCIIIFRDLLNDGDIALPCDDSALVLVHKVRFCTLGVNLHLRGDSALEPKIKD